MKTNNSTQYVGLLRKMYAVSNIWARSLCAVLVVPYFGLSFQTATYEMSRKCELEMFINKIKKRNEKNTFRFVAFVPFDTATQVYV